MPEPTESEVEHVSPAADSQAASSSIVADLERRIDELEHLPEERFGSFTALDWLLGAAGALLLPYALYLWFWP